MPDNWGFVLAAYGLAAVVLIAYWRFLFRREKELESHKLTGEGNHLSAPMLTHFG